MRSPHPQRARTCRALHAQAGWLAALAVVPGLACGDEPRATPNLLIVTVDTLRADHLGCYGYHRDTSPTLDALARESVVFEACQVPMAQTLPTHTSLFTGLYPREHGILANLDQAGGVFVPAPRIRTLATYLGESGFATAGFVSAEPVKRDGGLAAGFETWSEPERKKVPADSTIDRALRWLEAPPREPFLMWVHLFDPHMPYEPPPPYDTLFEADAALEAYLTERRIGDRSVRPERPTDAGNARREHDLYDGEVRFTDDQIARLFDGFRRAGVWENTVVVVTSDHGEALGQHGAGGHGGIWLEQLIVPLLVRVPGRAPERIATPLGAHDVVPTLLGLVDLPCRDFLDQASGEDVLAESPSARPIYSQFPASRVRAAESITVGGWRLIRGLEDEPLLFDLARDPFELTDLAAAQPERVAELERRLQTLTAEQSARGHRNEAGRVEKPSAERRSNLEALGYGGGDDGS